MAGFMIESRANPEIVSSVRNPSGAVMTTGAPTSRPCSTS